MSTEKNMELIGKLSTGEVNAEELLASYDMIQEMRRILGAGLARPAARPAAMQRASSAVKVERAPRTPRKQAPSADESTEVTDEQLVEYLDNNVSKDFHKLKTIADHFKIEKKTSIKPNLERLASEGKVFQQPQGYRSINFHGSRGRKPKMTVIEGGANDGRRGNIFGRSGAPKTLEEAQERKEAVKTNPKLTDEQKSDRIEAIDALIKKYRTESLTKTESTKKFNRRTAKAARRAKARAANTKEARKSA